MLMVAVVIAYYRQLTSTDTNVLVRVIVIVAVALAVTHWYVVGAPVGGEGG